MAGNIISRLLDETGDGTGNKDANGAYALAPAQFLIAPDAGKTFIIHRMIVSYADTKNWSADKYGQATTLVNGIQVSVHNDSGKLYDLTDPDKPIFTNGEWAGYCYDFTLFAFGSGNDWASIRWTFSKSGKAVTLRGDYGEKLIVDLEDDFDDLAVHHFLVQGYQVI